MSDDTLQELGKRFDELMSEVRRQGRAAIQAQAAAESCLEALAAARAPTAAAADERWLRTLLPVVDAIDRLSTTAAVIARQQHHRGRSWQFWRGTSSDGQLDSVAEGLRVLKAQLGSALAELGVEIDRPLGEPFDPERHRAVEEIEGPAGQIVEVVRAGYAVRGRTVREAEVAVGAKGRST